MAATPAQTNATNYRPSKGTLTVNGVNVEGIATGGVSFSFTDDLNMVTTGIDGSWIFTTKEACAGSCTVNLLQTSPSIPLFNALLFANKYNDSGTFLMVWRSDTGKEVVTMAAARFQKQPDMAFADSPSDRVYTIISGNMEVTEG